MSQETPPERMKGVETFMQSRESLILKYLSSGINRSNLILRHLVVILEEDQKYAEENLNLPNVAIPQKGTRDREERSISSDNLELFKSLNQELIGTHTTINTIIERELRKEELQKDIK